MAINSQLMMALRGMQQRPQGQLVNPLTSNQTSLVGDRQLPTQGRTITPIQGVKGGYNVAYDGRMVGQLLRGGPNGRFVSNGAPIARPLMQAPAQGLPSGPPQGQGMPQAPRQYAPNPFQQQMMQAQALRQPRGLQYG